MSGEGEGGERADWVRMLGAVAAAQDRDAFARLFDHFAPRIKTYMLRAGVNEAGADELAQETLLKVWRKAHLFDPASAGAATWIFTIARNLRIDAARRERRGGGASVSDAAAEFEIDPAPRPDASLAAAQSEALVRSALARLPPDQQRVVELSFFDDMAHAEIARVLDIPLGTAKSRLRLALQRLRGLLDVLS